jgi:hypothetical protein
MADVCCKHEWLEARKKEIQEVVAKDAWEEILNTERPM